MPHFITRSICLLLAAVFALSGVGKLLNADGAVQLAGLVAEQVGFVRGGAHSSLRVVVQMLSVAELVLAGLLVWSAAHGTRVWVLLTTVAMLGGFSALLAALMLGGVQVVSCGCSGVFDTLWGGGLSIEAALMRNLVLMALAFAAWMLTTTNEHTTNNEHEREDKHEDEKKQLSVNVLGH
jgi:hypothetical protein